MQKAVNFFWVRKLTALIHFLRSPTQWGHIYTVRSLKTFDALLVFSRFLNHQPTPMVSWGHGSATISSADKRLDIERDYGRTRFLGMNSCRENAHFWNAWKLKSPCSPTLFIHIEICLMFFSERNWFFNRWGMDGCEIVGFIFQK